MVRQQWSQVVVDAAATSVGRWVNVVASEAVKAVWDLQEFDLNDDEASTCLARQG